MAHYKEGKNYKDYSSMIPLTVMMVDKNAPVVKTVSLLLQETATVQEVTKFLKEEGKLSYPSYIMTNSPEKEETFASETTIKEIQPRCQTHDGRMVMVCL
jgi:hypothetical protein